MKVILMSDLRHRGRRGEVVEVKPGYARNYLFPQGMALRATPGNLRVFEHQRKKVEARHEAERSAAAGVAERIAAARIVLKKRAMETGALYGSVTAGEVVENLVGEGVQVDRRQIDLGGGIKSLGEHVVRIDLHSEVVAELAVVVEAEE